MSDEDKPRTPPKPSNRQEGSEDAESSVARTTRILKTAKARQDEIRRGQKRVQELEELGKVLRPSEATKPKDPIPIEPGSRLDVLAKFLQRITDALAKAPAKASVAEKDKPSKQGPTRSETMERFFAQARQVGTISPELGHYFMQWNPFALVIGYLLSVGGFALAVAVFPEKISPALYTFAEITFVLAVLFFVGKCIYDFRDHNERHLIRRLFVVAFIPILISVVVLFEYNRPQRIGGSILSQQEQIAKEQLALSYVPSVAILYRAKRVEIHNSGKTNIYLWGATYGKRPLEVGTEGRMIAPGFYYYLFADQLEDQMRAHLQENQQGFTPCYAYISTQDSKRHTIKCWLVGTLKNKELTIHTQTIGVVDGWVNE